MAFYYLPFLSQSALLCYEDMEFIIGWNSGLEGRELRKSEMFPRETMSQWKFLLLCWYINPLKGTSQVETDVNYYSSFDNSNVWWVLLIQIHKIWNKRYLRRIESLYLKGSSCSRLYIILCSKSRYSTINRSS